MINFKSSWILLLATCISFSLSGQLTSDDQVVSFSEPHIIPQSRSAKNGDAIKVTDFDGASSGEFEVALNFFTNTYNATARMIAIVDLAKKAINVNEYHHFASKKYFDQVKNNGTSGVTTVSQAYCQFKLYLSGNTLYLEQLMNPSGPAGVIRLDKSEWRAITRSQKEKADVNDIARSKLVGNGVPITVTDFNGQSSGAVHLNLNFFTTTYNQKAQMSATVDLDKKLIGVDSYQHFGSEKDNDPVISGGSIIVTASQAYSQFKLYLQNGVLYLEQVMNPGGASAKLRLEASSWSPLERFSFRLNQLKCIDTQDDGEDEIKIFVTADGYSVATIPSQGERDMNEESDIELWEIDKVFHFYKSMEITIQETDNTYHEKIGGKTLKFDNESPQGRHFKELTGPDDAHYNLSYDLFQGELENMPILSALFFKDNIIRRAYKDAAIKGGQPINDFIEFQTDQLEQLKNKLESDHINEERVSKLAEVAGSYAIDIGLSVVPLIVSGTANYLLVAGAATGGTIALAKATAATAGVALAVTAVASAIVLPIYFAGTKGTVFLEVANSSSQELEVESFTMSSGKKISGGDEGSIIPAKKPGLSPLAFYTFDKKWGLTGIIGEIKFKPTVKMPRGMIVRFSVPYSGENTVEVDIPDSGGGSNSDGHTSWNGYMRAHVGISSPEGFFPRVLVYLEDSSE